MKIIIYTLLLSLIFQGCLFSHKKSKHRKITKPEIYSRNIEINQKALIVGTNDYKGDARDLIGIERDIENVKGLISGWGFDVKVLKGAQTLNFQQALSEYANTLTNDDVFILYFSGHGSYAVDRSGDELDDDRDELIVLSDGVRNQFVVDDNIDKLLEKIKARKLVIFDSCYSGTVNRNYVPDSELKVKYIPAPPGVGDKPQDEEKIAPVQSFMSTTGISGPQIFLSACQDSEKSLTSSKGSLFTNTLLSYISLDKNVKTVYQQTADSLKRRFHPMINVTDESLKDETLKRYLKIKVN
jgi:hypothetical protein